VHFSEPHFLTTSFAATSLSYWKISRQLFKLQAAFLDMFSAVYSDFRTMVVMVYGIPNAYML